MQIPVFLAAVCEHMVQKTVLMRWDNTYDFFFDQCHWVDLAWLLWTPETDMKLRLLYLINYCFKLKTV